MIRAWLTLALCMLLTACAQLPAEEQTRSAIDKAQKTSGSGMDVPPVGMHQLVLNPSAGNFVELSLPVSVGRDYGTVLMIPQTYPHPKWNGTGSLCALVKESSHKTCIRFIARHDSQDITVETTFSTDPEDVSIRPLPGKFRRGEPILVRTEVLAGAVQFTVGKEAPETVAVEGTIDRLRILCASALCQYWLK